MFLWWLVTAVILRQLVPLVFAADAPLHVADVERRVSQLLQQRFLQNDNDDSFALLIPDITVETRVLGASLTVDLTEISCRDLSIDNITVDLQTPLANGIPVLLGFHRVNVTCQASYDYRILFGNGQGVVELNAVDASVQSSVVLVSPNLAIQPPNSVWFNECDTDITIEQLIFDGDGTGVVGQALNAAQPLVTPLVEREMADALCQRIEDMEDDFAVLLEELSTEWEPYWRGTTNPDSPLADIDIPFDALDLSNPSSTNLGTLFDLVLDRTGQLLREMDDTTGTLTINSFIQENLVDPVTGNYTIDSLDTYLGPDSLSYAVSTALGFLEVRLQRIVVQGLGNAIRRIDTVDITGPYTLQTGLLLSDVTLFVDAILTIRPLNGTTAITQALALDLPIERLDVRLAAVVLTSETTLGSIKLGTLLDTDNIFGCVSRGFDKVGLAEIDVREFVLDPASSFSTSVEWVSNIIESNLTMDMLNSAVEELLDGRECAENSFGLDGTVDWRDLLLSPDKAQDYGASGTEPYGDAGPFLKDYIDTVLLETNDEGYLGLAEQLIFPLTQSQSGQDGVWTFQDDIVDIDQDLDLGDVQARFELRLSDVRVQNLASIMQPTSIFDPIRFEAYRTFNQLTIGRKELPIRLAGTLAFAFESDVQIRNEVNILVELWDASLSTTLFLRMAEKHLVQFPLSSLFDIHCLASLLHTPELDKHGVRLESSQASFSLENLQVMLQGVRLSVDCVSCTSPEVEEISTLLKDPEKSKDAGAAIKSLINFVLGLAENDDSFLQLQIDRFLVDAAAQCKLREEYNPYYSGSTYDAFNFKESSSDSSLKVLLIMVAVIGCIAAATFAIVSGLRFIVSRRHRAWLKTLPRSQLVMIYATQKAKGEEEDQIDNNSTSLFASPEVPVFCRYFIPLVMICNIGLFLSSHFSLGGSVQIYIQLAGENVVIDNFYRFSIVQSALELWKVGGVELAILIFLFSGVWPYSKILITLGLWFSPSNRVPTRHRGSILMWLDTLGKWSMVDVFVMIITIVAFRVTIESPDYSFLPIGLYKVDLVVAPLWGLYANMTAQLVTQISSHIIIYYHRKIVAAGANMCLKHEESRVTDPTNATEARSRCKENDVDSIDAPIALKDSPFHRPHKGESDLLYARSAVSVLLAVASVVLIALLLFGFVMPSFSFENLGLVGIAIEFGQRFEQARTEYSIFDIVQLLIDQGRFLDSTRDVLGHFSVVSLLVASTLLVPYVLIAMLLLQFWYPFGSITRRRLDSLIEGVAAWCYVDVYLLSVIVATWQVGDISEYLVNPYCGGLDNTFAELVAYNIVEEEDAQCFRVRSMIEPAIYSLVASAVILSILMSFVTNACRHLEYQSNTLSSQRERRNFVHDDIDLEDDELREKIHPVPLLLTDRFRWLLRADKK